MKNELTLGEKIKRFREQKGLSQFKLEMLIGASPGSLSRIENGQINPTKETILKIVEILEISPSEAASLFNIDLESELRKFVDVTKVLYESKDLDEMLDLIINKISIYVGGRAAVLWLWDESVKGLRLQRVQAIEKIVKFFEKVVDLNPGKLLLLENEIGITNGFLRAILNKQVVISSELKDISYPILNKTLNAIAEKWLNFKISVSLPLLVKGERLGVFTIVWKKDELTPNDISHLQSYTDQMAIAIYNAKRYDELNKKYLELKEMYAK